MKIHFKKFSGNGNDFILLDQPLEKITPDIVQKICDRRFGVGGDGVLILRERKGFDGEMQIFNSDGSEAEMCGNGLRSLVTYLDLKNQNKKDSYLVKTPNAQYEVTKKDGRFAVEMAEIKETGLYELNLLGGNEKKFYVNTGVPHLVILQDEIEKINIKREGAFYRHHELFPKGTNVNFVEVLDKEKQVVKVRTYERGVEDETYSCGTGLVATALAIQNWFGWSGRITLRTLGGEQTVMLDGKVFYSGEVKFCFEGDFFL